MVAYRGRGQFLNFLGSNDFIKQKLYFSRLMRVCIGLIMLAACTVLNPGFLAYLSVGFGRFLQVSALAFHWLADCANLRQRRGKQLLSEQYKQQANILLSINNYTPLVISRFNKNKQLTLLG